MTWFILSLFAALFDASKNVVSKKGLVHLDEYVMLCGLNVFSLLVFLPAVIAKPFPSLTTDFWIILLISGTIAAVGLTLTMRAFRISDLSLTVPLISFSPVFLLIIAGIFLKEYPTPLGLLGVICIFMGSYLLKIDQRRKGILRPFQALLNEKGPRLMFIVAFLWAINGTIEKIAIGKSSPEVWATLNAIYMSIIFSILMIWKSKKHLSLIPKKLPLLILQGLLHGGMLLSQYHAFRIAILVYVSSIKQTSSLFSVLFGWYFFGEKDINKRLIASTVMLIGVIMILLG